MADVYDTRSKPDGERMDFWVDTVCRQIFPVAIDPRHDTSPSAAMRCATFGVVGMRQVIGGDHVYVRSAGDVKRIDPGTVQIGMPIRGSSLLIQDGREAVLAGGDMVIYDSARPFTLVMRERFDWQVFLVPKELVGKSDLELATLTARRLDAAAGLPALVSHFLRDLAIHADEVETDGASAAVGHTVADLLMTLIGGALGSRYISEDPDGVLHTCAVAFMDSHHFDPRLDPAAIAAAACVCVRRLHAAFEGTGATVMDTLRDIRLQAIRRDLHDPRLRNQAIGQIAALHGMPNATVFSRIFRNQFGCSARDFRANHAMA